MNKPNVPNLCPPCLLLMLAFVLSGCGRDLLAHGDVMMEPRLDSVMRSPPSVTEAHGDLVVSGRLSSRFTKSADSAIAVSVTAPDGSMVYEASVRYHDGASSSAGLPAPTKASFRSVYARHSFYGAYDIRFPGLPPRGSVLRVRFIPPRPDTEEAPTGARSCPHEPERPIAFTPG